MHKKSTKIKDIIPITGDPAQLNVEGLGLEKRKKGGSSNIFNIIGLLQSDSHKDVIERAAYVLNAWLKTDAGKKGLVESEHGEHHFVDLLNESMNRHDYCKDYFSSCIEGAQYLAHYDKIKASVACDGYGNTTLNREAIASMLSAGYEVDFWADFALKTGKDDLNARYQSTIILMGLAGMDCVKGVQMLQKHGLDVGELVPIKNDFIGKILLEDGEGQPMASLMAMAYCMNRPQIACAMAVAGVDPARVHYEREPASLTLVDIVGRLAAESSNAFDDIRPQLGAVSNAKAAKGIADELFPNRARTAPFEVPGAG